MRHVALADPVDFAGWRSAARAALMAREAPDAIRWSVAGGEDAGDLFAHAEVPAWRATRPPPSVPRGFLEVAQRVILHRDALRFALLYRLLWRLQAEPRLMAVASDPDLHAARRLAQAVRRDIHKMKAFLRFREVAGSGEAEFVAWFEPDNHIVEAAAPFFVHRFAGMRWTILTPLRSACWDGAALRFGAGATRDQAPRSDRLDAHWRAYYASIFNPARVKVAAMLREMPRKYWHNLPETAAVRNLVQAAGVRSHAMIAAPPTLPPRFAASEARRRPAPASPADRPATLAEARGAAAACRRCPLWADATQVVFGEGDADSPMMLIGEQPGDREDLAGRPFVGPAGQLLDRALAEAGIRREAVYVTNAVKHFKHEPRGKVRLHKKPGAGEIEACRWWLEIERALVRPRLLVALGASAAQAILHRTVRILAERGRPIAAPDGATLWLTVHPSYLLRLPDARAKAEQYGRFVADLRAARDWLERAA